MQKVTIGISLSGKPGYFTGGYMAMPLSLDQYAMPREWHVANCARLGFQLCEVEA